MSNKQDEINFARVADAIEYITRNYQEQPSLFDIAAVYYTHLQSGDEDYK